MTYIKASEEVVDAAIAFVRVHEDIYRLWSRRPDQEIPCLEFMRLCEAVLRGHTKAGGPNGTLPCNRISAIPRQMVLQSSPPAECAAPEATPALSEDVA